MADKIVVVTKAAGEDGREGKQWRWESRAGSSFTIAEDVGGQPIAGISGTRVTLHLKEDCDE